MVKMAPESWVPGVALAPVRGRAAASAAAASKDRMLRMGVSFR